MRRATVTIPEDLERALESYNRDLEFSPSLAALVQAALREYLQQRGYVVREGGTGSRPSMYEGAPFIRGDKTAAQMVIEDRR
jgi:hypothetical protein